nr:hypothetical protein [Mycoplasmopsis bovis]
MEEKENEKHLTKKNKINQNKSENNSGTKVKKRLSIIWKFN